MLPSRPPPPKDPEPPSHPKHDRVWTGTQRLGLVLLHTSRLVWGSGGKGNQRRRTPSDRRKLAIVSCCWPCAHIASGQALRWKRLMAPPSTDARTRPPPAHTWQMPVCIGEIDLGQSLSCRGGEGGSGDFILVDQSKPARTRVETGPEEWPLAPPAVLFDSTVGFCSAHHDTHIPFSSVSNAPAPRSRTSP